MYLYLVDYFNSENMKLGQKIDISKITSDILGLGGVKSLKTVNTAEDSYFNGLSFVIWNPLFEGADENFINQNTTLEYFKFPYLFSPNNLINKIEIVDE